MRRKISKLTINKIIRLYQKDYAISRIAELCGVSWPTVRTYLKKYSIYGQRGDLPARSIHGRPDLEKRIIHEYTKGRSIKMIAKKYKLSEPSVSKYLSFKGIHRGTTRTYARYTYDHNKINELIRKGCTYAAIARHIGTPYRIFYGYMKYHRFPKPYVYKLSIADIPDINYLVDQGERMPQIAQQFKVGYRTLLSFMRKHRISSPVGRPRKDYIEYIDKE